VIEMAKAPHYPRRIDRYLFVLPGRRSAGRQPFAGGQPILHSPLYSYLHLNRHPWPLDFAAESSAFGSLFARRRWVRVTILT
jgi:hypothetical protein